MVSILSGSNSREVLDASQKGLINRPGENHCFLNGVIQVLFHLDVFRNSINRIAKHECNRRQGSDVAVCVVCAIQSIFSEYQFGYDTHIPSIALRNALSELYADKSRFQLRAMDDAAEAFEAVAWHIHRTLVDTRDRSSRIALCSTQCLVHDIFGTTVEEKYICACGGMRDAMKFDKFIQYVPAAGIKYMYEKIAQSSGFQPSHQGPDGAIPNKFEQILRDLILPEPRSCDACSHCVQPSLTRVGRPPLVAVFGLVWESGSVSREEVVSVLGLIQPVIDYDLILHVDKRSSPCSMICSGVICYYGKHYVAYCYNSIKKAWVMFDDVNIREVGPSWQDLLTACRKNKYQPAVLFYRQYDESTAHTLPSHSRHPGEVCKYPIRPPVRPPGPFIQPMTKIHDHSEPSPTNDAAICEMIMEQDRENQLSADLALAIDMQQRLQVGEPPITHLALYESKRSNPDLECIHQEVLPVKVPGVLGYVWRLRRCVLDRHLLRVYRLDKNDPDVIRNDLTDGVPIDLNYAVIIDAFDSKKQRKSEKPNRFSIVDRTSHKPFLIMAPRLVKDRDMWLDCIGSIGVAILREM
eukprot:Ihof_evm4s192 gene=Ihof_evmTU4s192